MRHVLHLLHFLNLLNLLLLVVGRDIDTREDGLCGGENLAPTGRVATCPHIPPFPTCCQSNGHCGWDCEDVGDLNAPVVNQPAPVSSPVAPKPASAPVFTSTGRYRSDGKCGAINPLEDGNPAECDPNSQYWCCSEHGFCGGTHEHCSCDTCINFRPLQVEGEIRNDRRCGADFPLEDGTPGGCDGSGPNPCCSLHGYCGPGDAHCACVGCVDYRSGLGLTVPLVEGTVRNDRRCGKDFKLADGNPSECDGSSANPCCSKWGYCGPGADHCGCPTCTDFRTQSKVIEDDFEGAWRKDRRCGSDFPLPSGDPAECNPNSENFCCSKWGFCGSDGEHCTCDECVNYAKKK